MNQNPKLNCLHIYDNKFTLYLGDVYSSGRMTDDVYKRYIHIQDTIVSVSRMQKAEHIEKLTKITIDNIVFKPIKGLSFSKIFTIHLIHNSIGILNEIRNADFIVIRLPSFLGIYCLILNILFRRKYFIEVVGDAQEALITSKKNPSKSFESFVHVFFRLNQYFIKNANGVIYVTKEALQKKYPTLGISSYASNVNISLPKKHLHFKCYSKKDNLFKIGVIADYNNHYKGLTEAIKAISSLKDKGYSLSLHILGSGTLLNHYINLSSEYNVQDLVCFEGRLNNNSEIMQWLEKLDVYIQPSYTEGLPRALIEAMSVGLPAVATNVGGVSELIQDKHLVEPYNYQKLTNRIECFLKSQELRYEAGSLNYEKARNYDSEVLIKRRANFWKKCRLIVLNKMP